MIDWTPVEKRLPDLGEEVLAVWPMLRYDEDHNQLTEEVERYTIQKVQFLWNKRFDDPPNADAIGDYFGDDYEYAEQPTHWMPLPALPAGLKPLTPK